MMGNLTFGGHAKVAGVDNRQPAIIHRPKFGGEPPEDTFTRSAQPDGSEPRVLAADSLLPGIQLVSQAPAAPKPAVSALYTRLGLESAEELDDLLEKIKAHASETVEKNISNVQGSQVIASVAAGKEMKLTRLVAQANQGYQFLSSQLSGYAFKKTLDDYKDLTQDDGRDFRYKQAIEIITEIMQDEDAIADPANKAILTGIVQPVIEGVQAQLKAAAETHLDAMDGIRERISEIVNKRGKSDSWPIMSLRTLASPNPQTSEESVVGLRGIITEFYNSHNKAEGRVLPDPEAFADFVEVALETPQQSWKDLGGIAIPALPDKMAGRRSELLKKYLDSEHVGNNVAALNPLVREVPPASPQEQPTINATYPRTHEVFTRLYGTLKTNFLEAYNRLLKSDQTEAKTRLCNLPREFSYMDQSDTRRTGQYL